MGRFCADYSLYRSKQFRKRLLRASTFSIHVHTVPSDIYLHSHVISNCTMCISLLPNFS